VFVDLCTGKRELISTFPMVKIEGNINKMMEHIFVIEYIS